MKCTLASSRRAFRGLLASAILVSGAIAGPAVAATATLSGTTGNSCTWNSYTVDSAGNYTFACGTTAPSPGQIAFSSSSYAVNINATTTVPLVRTGGSSGAVGATVSAGTGCTISGSNTVSFADGVTTGQSVTIQGGTSPTPTGSPCVLSLSDATGGATLGGNANVSVNDPNAPGTFAFALPSGSNATTGSTHTVTVSRIGGTFGDYTVAFAEQQTGVTGYVTSTLSPISFASGVASMPINVSATGTTSGTVTYTLGTVTPVNGNTVNTSASGSHMVTVTAVTAGSCPAPAANTITIPQLASGANYTANANVGSVYTVPLNANTSRVRVYNTSSTPGGFQAEFGVSNCPGVMFSDWPQFGHMTDLVNGHLGGCRKVADQTGNALDIKTASQLGACWATSADRLPAWYMTTKVISCGTLNGVTLTSCSFYIQVD
jgi:hypothetical protein